MIAALILAATDSAHAGPAMDVDWGYVGQWILAIASGGSILTGLFFVFAGTLGVLRLPDFYSRIHAAGMTDTLGAELVMLGLMLQAGFSQMTLKLLMISFFLLLTSPTATHAVANAAYRAGLKPRLGPYKAKDLSEIGAAHSSSKSSAKGGA